MDRSEAVFVVILNRQVLMQGVGTLMAAGGLRKIPRFVGRSCTASGQLIKHLPPGLTTERIFSAIFLIEFLRIAILHA